MNAVDIGFAAEPLVSSVVDVALVGPPADLPGPVPGFVEQLLGAVGEFVSGVVGGPAGDAPGPAAGGR